MSSSPFALVLLTLLAREATPQGDYFKSQESAPGPWVSPAVGSVWPRPRVFVAQDTYFHVDPHDFHFEVGRSRLGEI